MFAVARAHHFAKGEGFDVTGKELGGEVGQFVVGLQQCPEKLSGGFPRLAPPETFGTGCFIAGGESFCHLDMRLDEFVAR